MTTAAADLIKRFEVEAAPGPPASQQPASTPTAQRSPKRRPSHGSVALGSRAEAPAQETSLHVGAADEKPSSSHRPKARRPSWNSTKFDAQGWCRENDLKGDQPVCMNITSVQPQPRESLRRPTAPSELQKPASGLRSLEGTLDKLEADKERVKQRSLHSKHALEKLRGLGAILRAKGQEGARGWKDDTGCSSAVGMESGRSGLTEPITDAGETRTSTTSGQQGDGVGESPGEGQGEGGGGDDEGSDDEHQEVFVSPSLAPLFMAAFAFTRVKDSSTEAEADTGGTNEEADLKDFSEIGDAYAGLDPKESQEKCLQALFNHFASVKARTSDQKILTQSDFELFCQSLSTVHKAKKEKGRTSWKKPKKARVREVFEEQISLQTSLCSRYGMTHGEAAKGLCFETFRTCMHRLYYQGLASQDEFQKLLSCKQSLNGA